MNYLDNIHQHTYVLIEGLREAKNPKVFKSNNLCVFVGFAGDGKSCKTILKKEEKEM
jgi:hypothetical protein